MTFLDLFLIVVIGVVGGIAGALVIQAPIVVGLIYEELLAWYFKRHYLREREEEAIKRESERSRRERGLPA